VRLSGQKKGLIAAPWNTWRKNINDTVMLSRHIKLIQPSGHFFDKIQQRNMDFTRIQKILYTGLMMYGKRIAVQLGSSPEMEFTFVANDYVIPISVIPVSKRAVGILDDEQITIMIITPTAFQINNRGQAKSGQYIMQQKYTNMLLVTC